jgi:hypothetical protein
VPALLPKLRLTTNRNRSAGERIGAHLGAPTAQPRIAPVRGPPLWEAAGAEWVDQSRQWDPLAPAYEFHQRIGW